MNKAKNYFDFVIVGQGIAGTLLAHFLLKHNKSVLVIDNNHISSSSKIAAGIVNPITGKNFVLSWRINEFLPVAYETYDEISEKLNITAYTKINIIRTFDTIEEENSWLGRTADPTLSHYIVPKADSRTFDTYVKPVLGYGELTQTMQVNMEDIINAFKSMFISRNSYVNECFDYLKLKIDADHYQYNDYTFKSIIFCEGYKGAFNPFFENIGFASAKGEVLIIKIKNIKFVKIYKAKIFIVPMNDDIYWVGSGYEWDATDDHPTVAGKEKLISELDKILDVPYEIIDHKAAIRPTIYIRRPVVKMHPTNPEMYFFNGLGTKGASIGPYYARQLANYLVFKNPTDLNFN